MNRTVHFILFFLFVYIAHAPFSGFAQTENTSLIPIEVVEGTATAEIFSYEHPVVRLLDLALLIDLIKIKEGFAQHGMEYTPHHHPENAKDFFGVKLEKLTSVEQIIRITEDQLLRLRDTDPRGRKRDEVLRREWMKLTQEQLHAVFKHAIKEADKKFKKPQTMTVKMPGWEINHNVQNLLQDTESRLMALEEQLKSMVETAQIARPTNILQRIQLYLRQFRKQNKGTTLPHLYHNTDQAKEQFIQNEETERKQKQQEEQQQQQKPKTPTPDFTDKNKQAIRDSFRGLDIFELDRVVETFSALRTDVFQKEFIEKALKEEYAREYKIKETAYVEKHARKLAPNLTEENRNNLTEQLKREFAKKNEGREQRYIDQNRENLLKYFQGLAHIRNRFNTLTEAHNLTIMERKHQEAAIAENTMDRIKIAPGNKGIRQVGRDAVNLVKRSPGEFLVFYLASATTQNFSMFSDVRESPNYNTTIWDHQLASIDSYIGFGFFLSGGMIGRPLTRLMTHTIDSSPVQRVARKLRIGKPGSLFLAQQLGAQNTLAFQLGLSYLAHNVLYALKKDDMFEKCWKEVDHKLELTSESGFLGFFSSPLHNGKVVFNGSRQCRAFRNMFWSQLSATLPQEVLGLIAAGIGLIAIELVGKRHIGVLRAAFPKIFRYAHLVSFMFIAEVTMPWFQAEAEGRYCNPLRGHWNLWDCFIGIGYFDGYSDLIAKQMGGLLSLNMNDGLSPNTYQSNIVPDQPIPYHESIMQVDSLENQFSGLRGILDQATAGSYFSWISYLYSSIKTFSITDHFNNIFINESSIQLVKKDGNVVIAKNGTPITKESGNPYKEDYTITSLPKEINPTLFTGLMDIINKNKTNQQTNIAPHQVISFSPYRFINPDFKFPQPWSVEQQLSLLKFFFEVHDANKPVDPFFSSPTDQEETKNQLFSDFENNLEYFPEKVFERAIEDIMDFSISSSLTKHPLKAVLENSDSSSNNSPEKNRLLDILKPLADDFSYNMDQVIQGMDLMSIYEKNRGKILLHYQSNVQNEDNVQTNICSRGEEYTLKEAICIYLELRHSEDSLDKLTASIRAASKNLENSPPPSNQTEKTLIRNNMNNHFNKIQTILDKLDHLSIVPEDNDGNSLSIVIRISLIYLNNLNALKHDIQSHNLTKETADNIEKKKCQTEEITNQTEEIKKIEEIICQTWETMEIIYQALAEMIDPEDAQAITEKLRTELYNIQNDNNAEEIIYQILTHIMDSEYVQAFIRTPLEINKDWTELNMFWFAIEDVEKKYLTSKEYNKIEETISIEELFVHEETLDSSEHKDNEIFKKFREKKSEELLRNRILISGLYLLDDIVYAKLERNVSSSFGTFSTIELYKMVENYKSDPNEWKQIRQYHFQLTQSDPVLKLFKYLMRFRKPEKGGNKNDPQKNIMQEIRSFARGELKKEDFDHTFQSITDKSTDEEASAFNQRFNHLNLNNATPDYLMLSAICGPDLDKITNKHHTLYVAGLVNEAGSTRQKHELLDTLYPKDKSTEEGVPAKNIEDIFEDIPLFSRYDDLGVTIPGTSYKFTPPRWKHLHLPDDVREKICGTNTEVFLSNVLRNGLMTFDQLNIQWNGKRYTKIEELLEDAIHVSNGNRNMDSPNIQLERKYYANCIKPIKDIEDRIKIEEEKVETCIKNLDINPKEYNYDKFTCAGREDIEQCKENFCIGHGDSMINTDTNQNVGSARDQKIFYIRNKITQNHECFSDTYLHLPKQLSELRTKKDEVLPDDYCKWEATVKKDGEDLVDEIKYKECKENINPTRWSHIKMVQPNSYDEFYSCIAKKIQSIYLTQEEYCSMIEPDNPNCLKNFSKNIKCEQPDWGLLLPNYVDTFEFKFNNWWRNDVQPLQKLFTEVADWEMKSTLKTLREENLAQDSIYQYVEIPLSTDKVLTPKFELSQAHSYIHPDSAKIKVRSKVRNRGRKSYKHVLKLDMAIPRGGFQNIHFEMTFWADYILYLAEMKNKNEEASIDISKLKTALKEFIDTYDYATLRLQGKEGLGKWETQFLKDNPVESVQHRWKSCNVISNPVKLKICDILGALGIRAGGISMINHASIPKDLQETSSDEGKINFWEAGAEMDRAFLLDTFSEEKPGNGGAHPDTSTLKQANETEQLINLTLLKLWNLHLEVLQKISMFHTELIEDPQIKSY